MKYVSLHTVKKFREHAFMRAAATFLGLSFFIAGTSLVYPNANEQFATVAGMTAGVEPNEINRLAQEFSDRERVLSEREVAIKEEEERLRLMFQEELAKERLRTILFSGGMSVILLLLIGVNYYLDLTRRKKEEGTLQTTHTGELQTRL